jgi:hypothetical protein
MRPNIERSQAGMGEITLDPWEPSEDAFQRGGVVQEAGLLPGPLCWENLVAGYEDIIFKGVRRFIYYTASETGALTYINGPISAAATLGCIQRKLAMSTQVQNGRADKAPDAQLAVEAFRAGASG